MSKRGGYFIDRRTKRGKRLSALVRQWRAQLGREPTPTQVAAIEHAAAVTILAQDAAVSRLNGGDTSHDDVVRLSRAASLAVRKIGLPKESAPAEGGLQAFLAQREQEAAL